VSEGNDLITSDSATLTVRESLVLGQYSQQADASTWILDGPAPTLDFNTFGPLDDGWGRVLLRVDDVLLVGGDFTGIRQSRSSSTTPRPWLAALDAVTGQPVSTFQVPFQVDSVVRSLVLSPNGNQVYVGGDFGLLVVDAITGELDFTVSVSEGNRQGRVFDIAVSQTQIYIGGEFNNVEGVFRHNIARLSLNGALDGSWSPNVQGGFNSGSTLVETSRPLMTRMCHGQLKTQLFPCLCLMPVLGRLFDPRYSHRLSIDQSRVVTENA